MRYGNLEYFFAEAFANALVEDQDFSAWVLRRTKFRELAQQARLLHEEMFSTRSKAATTWWRSHFTEKCRCPGCSGQETDLLAVFETNAKKRFALHVEVKQPRDRFPAHKRQGVGYGIRAACWAASAPVNVVQHSESSTLLLCCETKVQAYGENASDFDAVITFQQIAREFPKATCPL